MSQVIDIKTPLECDVYTDDVSEDEMDQDLKKALKDMTEAIAVLAQCQSRPTDYPRGDGSAVLASIESRLVTLEERSAWHEKIGWGIAGLYGAAVVAIITFWIPREMTGVRESVVQTVKIDTASQLLPIQTQLARLTGLVELRQSKNVATAIQQSADDATPLVAIEAVKAIVQQAKEEKLAAPPGVLRSANTRIQNAAASDPKLRGAAWSARLALLDYQSSLQEPFKGQTVAGTNQEPPFKTPPLPVITEFVIRDISQKLDGVFWKDMVFENVHVVYDGGPMAMQNVRFINCTFSMSDTWRTDKLANLILDYNIVSGSLG
jgi:hypothetical protein